MIEIIAGGLAATALGNTRVGRRVTNAISNVGKRIGAQAMKSPVFAGFANMGWAQQLRRLLSGTKFDYRAAAGDLWTHSIVLIAIMWYCRNFSQGRVCVKRTAEDGTVNMVPHHPLTKLLKRPNKFWSGRLLWFAVNLSLMVDGNAYLLKMRSPAGKVIELWWLPHFMVEPRRPADGSVYISHYDYTVNGEIWEIDPDDIIHFREGIDPRNDLKGLAPLSASLREVCTDAEAANFSATLMRNCGLPGVVITPIAGEEAEDLNPKEQSKIARKWRETVSGDGVGRAFVNPFPLKIEFPGFSPEQMVLDKLRALPEQRIAASYGIPPVVLGLGTGLVNASAKASHENSSYAAWTASIIPGQDARADELETQLLDDIGMGTSANEEVGFDNSRVAALRENMNDLFKRNTLAVGGPWLTPDDARVSVNMPKIEGGDVLYPPMGQLPLNPAPTETVEPDEDEEEGIDEQ